MFKTLSIKNFRGIDNLEIKNLNKINIFVGRNGIGKSTILDAAYIAINPNNTSLILKTNLFRNFDQALNNDNFWKSYFYNFNESNTISIKLENNKKSRSLNIKPKFQSKSIISKNKDEKNIIDLDHEEKIVLGLDTEFSINKKSFNSTVSQIDFATIESKLDNNFKDDLKGNYLNNKTFLDSNNITRKFNEVIVRKQKEKIINLLQKFNSNITDIALNHEQRIIVNDNRFPEMISANIYGDGFLKALHLICNILGDESDIILVDEIENGIDIKFQAIIWKTILDLIKDTDKQIFISTHSYEMIKNLFEVTKKENCSDLFTLFRIQHDRNNKLIVIDYLEKDMLGALERGEEVR